MIDLTIFLQGPLHQTGIDNCHEYLKYGDVKVVCYENDNNKHLLKKLPSEITVVEIPPPLNTDNFFNFNNTYIQTYGIYQSLLNVDTEFCIRTRCDESFPNMDIFVNNMNNHKEKIHVTNLYSFKDDEHKFCMGNHIFGGRTSYLLKGFAWGMKACKFDVMGKYNCGATDRSQMFYKDKHGDTFPMWSEIFNTVCMLQGKDVEIEVGKSKEIVKENFMLTPLKDFPEFMWTHKHSKHEPITDNDWGSQINSRFLDSIEDV